ncbi:hypothetical protein N0002_05500 [Pseudomonas aeruginosa]|uniref:Uncharacterized protein n=1 Tax=Pseudomonas aeruginosa TaxID=287 RepID=A0A7M2ZXG9_PSEAI|nr:MULTISPECIES: hypothetical protein [Pseudomonas]ECA4546648.1 hypothetical protein [Salmonella enterica subsp. enterica serovar Typhimurium]ETU83356.1 hypothetical protein Q053_05086 [Pseudomonas aeruginosa BWHPSA048]HCL2591690.1 hypothetical protein [Pseudomonas aeruginosa C40A]ARH18330.1 hypothetical protein HV97_33230 [Pseudomonas aeruginosa]AYW75819.1 hypothetical protein EGV95_31860 [Pseudomonas aeruginosa]
MSLPPILVAQNQVSTGVDQFTTALTGYLNHLGLPTNNVLVPVHERQRVIGNLPDVINSIDLSKRAESLYISKFIAACGAGLFDAALNFIWDETVVSLRNKVARFDLEYFYDSVITDATRRSKLRDEDDLVKIEEWELVRGCHVTGILSDIGYRHLDYIRDMRNWASAAHPNQNELSGLQLISWLETCLREVIAKEPEPAAIEVKRFLHSVRTQILTEQDAQHIRAGMERLPVDIIKSLLRAIFGMYTADNTSTQVKTNIRFIGSKCWALAPDDTRYECGFRFTTFAANGENGRKALAHEFLKGVDGLGYLSPDSLAVEMSVCINALFNAHSGFNNFHNEPAHARNLLAYVPANGQIPESVRVPYVKTLIMARVGNGYGVSDMAIPNYQSMIARFGEDEFKEFVKLIIDRQFQARLTLRNCSTRFKELAASFLPLTANQITHGALTSIIGSTDQHLPNLGRETAYTRIVSAY